MIREDRLILPLGGLICRDCEDNVRNALMTEKGILSVSASYIKGTAAITYDPDVINVDEIKAALSESGYSVTEKPRCGIIYDVLTVISVAVVTVALKIIPLPGIPSLVTDGGNIYLSVFLIGLVSGTHCIVMCGGIMLSSAGRNTQKAERLLNIMLYNMSRILISAVLGFIFASVGRALVFSDTAKSMLHVFAGLYVVFSALSIWGVPGIRTICAALPHPSFFNHRGMYTGPVITGIFTAVMPCSLSSTMWMTAMTLSSGLEGALMMTLWALGTLPLMLIFGMVSGMKRGRHQGLTIRINIVLLLSLGMRLILMGLT